MNSDTLVRWNTAKEIPKNDPLDASRAKRDVRFNLPEIKFSHDDGGWNWMDSEQDNATTTNELKTPVDKSLLHPNTRYANRADSVATHVLDSHLESTNTMLRLKRQARQERRALKESGDYLGVQGINPETGQLDIETPTDSEESRPSHDTSKENPVRPGRLVGSFNQDDLIDDFVAKEEKKRLLQARLDELCRMEKGKQEAQDLNGQLVWRRHTKEWSIVRNPSQNNTEPLVQGASQAKSPNPPNTDKTYVRKPNTRLIDLASSQMPGISDENPDFQIGSHYNDISDGTVVRTPHQQSLADVSRSALELFQNGISFDNSGQSNGVGLGISLRHISSPAVSPTSRLAREPNLMDFLEGSEPSFNFEGGVAGNNATDEKFEHFLDQNRTQPPEPGRENCNIQQSKVSRGAFQKLTKILRTQRSLGSIAMANTQARMQNAAQKHIFKREMSMPAIPLSKVDAWIVDVAQRTKDGGNPPENTVGACSEDPVLKSAVEISNRGARETIIGDLDALQKRVQIVDAMRNNSGGQQRGCLIDQQPMQTTIVDLTGRWERIDESVCTPIIITTGYHQDVELLQKLVNCKEIVGPRQEESTICYPETKLNALPKAGEAPTATQNATTSATPSKCNQESSVRYLKMTHGATRTRIRTTTLQKESHATEPLSSTSPPQEANAQTTPKVKLKIAYAEERRRREQSIPNAPISQKVSLCGVCSECLQVPGGFPVHPIADGAIARHSEGRDSNSVRQKHLATRMGTLCNNTVGQLIAALELYCTVVWPVFDPYSALWERNAKKETTLVDMLVVMLALPGAIAAIAVALWGLKVVTAI